MTSSPTTKTILVVGATGGTGRHVVRMILDQGHQVRVVVRSEERLLKMLPGHTQQSMNRLDITEATLLDLSDATLEDLTRGCTAIISCLGHTGARSKPHDLVTEAVKRLTQAAVFSNPASKSKVKLILMSSNGVANPNGGDDQRPRSERIVLSLVRALIPAHRDNESAALYLHEMQTNKSFSSSQIEWCVVRPDDLVDADVSEYELLTKPKKGLFFGGTATRSNVAQAMVRLVLNDAEWQKWKFQMPVLNDMVPVNSKSKRSAATNVGTKPGTAVTVGAGDEVEC